tara:strand:- start:969 stop:1253 length:285 start_codon:yes stop_codon:yes gene_type:complete
MKKIFIILIIPFFISCGEEATCLKCVPVINYRSAVTGKQCDVDVEYNVCIGEYHDHICYPNLNKATIPVTRKQLKNVKKTLEGDGIAICTWVTK